MPPFSTRNITVALDMYGCPNRCRHCWLGKASRQQAGEAKLRQVAEQFRHWIHPGETQPFIERLTVASWFREPDYADNYRELWALEQELSDAGAAQRFELLSIWRLARDESYARWAREIGTEACQITFFGMEKTTDFFARRKGAFRDSLLATERLLDAGIRPRWQLFLTTAILPELPALLELVREMRLEERVRQLGHEFQLFIHTPGPSGEGFRIEHLRPTVEALQAIPPYLAEKTLAHFGAAQLAECLGGAEGELVARLREEPSPVAYTPGITAFFVTPELDVYPNHGDLMPWWRLGNIDMDGLDAIMARYEADDTPGLQVNYHVPVAELAARYGQPDSRQLHSQDTLAERWIYLWGEEKNP